MSDNSSYTTSGSSLELASTTGRVSVSGNERKPPPELRHRKHNNGNNNNNHHQSTKKRKKKKRRWRWIVGKPRDITVEQEQVFMTMKLRKLNRALTGTKTKKTKFEFLALVAYFVLAFGVVSYTSTETEQEAVPGQPEARRIIVLDLSEIIFIMIYILVVSLITSVFRESKFITLLYWMFIYLPLFFMVVAFIMDDVGELGDWGGFLGRNPVVAFLLITAEMFVLTVFLSLYKIYPKVVQSNWFRRKKRAGVFWRIKVISDWTMTYVGSWGRRFTCKYDGETNEDGLPHGFGRWLDDSFSGEVLTGTWINGIPVAPFASRQFGTGDAFKAVRIGYVMASDDEFTATNFWPTNEKEPRIGMCSVECSISGSFYNELPLATHLSGPHWMDEDQHTVAKLCRQLTHIDEEEEREHQLVQIKASDPRGVQIRGHVHGVTGESFHPGIDTVVIRIDQDALGDNNNNHNKEQAQPGSPVQGMRRNNTTSRSMSNLNYMPRAARQNWRSERIIVCDESDSGDESDRQIELQTVEEEDSQSMSHSNVMKEEDDSQNISHSNAIKEEEDSQNMSHSDAIKESPAAESKTLSEQLEPPPAAATPPTNSHYTLNPGSYLSNMMQSFPNPRMQMSFPNPPRMQMSFPNPSVFSASSVFGGGSNLDAMELGMSERTTTIVEPIRMANASLSVQDWIPAPHKDALIFFPGYKVPLKNALEALGQFIAMTRLDSRVYPIIFGWPCGQRLTYHPASRCSATDKNRDNVLRLLKGLQAAGIRNVHIMTHSMGAQSMLGAFSDLADGSRSGVSQMFHLDPDFIDEEDGAHNRTSSSEDRSLMVCRTVTMLNPDFPLEAFVDRGFESVRRVCSTVTIIGDRHDKALLISQVMNGMAVYSGYDQPEVLQPKPNRALGEFSEQEVYLGRYKFLQEVIGLRIESLYFPTKQDREGQNDALLFKVRAPVIVCTDDEPVADRAWLDLDVIDTTGLDTNIAGIRHSGFNLNPILLKDLEELISTGRRAVSRATLLYRDGNLFSYCHAPSYVAM